MKNKVYLILITAFVAAGLFFIGCETEAGIARINSVTVTFNSNGGSPVTPNEVIASRGQAMGDSFPANPTNAPLVFYGWWDSGIEYDRNSVIYNDLNLVARWANTATDLVVVTFDSAGGSAVPDTSFLQGSPLGLRYPVTRLKNYSFDGWFDESTDQEYTADAPAITGPITLTARWTEKEFFTVTFDTEDRVIGEQQDSIPPVKVYEGEGLEGDLPLTLIHNNPEVYFVSWAGEEDQPYDEFTPIYEDMVFYAKWGKAPYVVDLSDPAMTFHTGAGNYEAAYIPETGTIKNTVMYDGSGSRWQILYRLGLDGVLPVDFNNGYYSKYTVSVNFYGNQRAIPSDPDFNMDVLYPAYDPIENVGDLMTPENGYGQLSWCINTTSNGDPGNDGAGVILQQYNLGVETVNATWAVAGSYTAAYNTATLPDALVVASRPPVLLIQTSDSWIGWIEITEISFHNGEGYEDSGERDD